MPDDDLDAAVIALREARDAVPEAQQQAKAVVSDARTKVDQARERLAAAIVAAYKRGEKQGTIVTRTGYTRESVRRILRAGGIEPPD